MVTMSVFHMDEECGHGFGTSGDLPGQPRVTQGTSGCPGRSPRVPNPCPHDSSMWKTHSYLIAFVVNQRSAMFLNLCIIFGQFNDIS